VEYNNRGFPEAGVSIETEKLSTKDVRVRIEVKEGKGKKIKEIKLDGTINYMEKKKLRQKLFLSYHKTPLIDSNLMDMKTEIEKYWVKKGYPAVAARVNTEGKGVVSVNINTSFFFRINIKNARFFSPYTIEDVVKSVDEYYDSPDAIRKKLINYYDVYGFPSAKVEISLKNYVEKERNVKEMDIYVDAGDRKFLEDIVFSGIKGDFGEKLKERLAAFVEKSMEDENFPDISINRSETGGGYRDIDRSHVRAIYRSKKNKVLLPDANLIFPEKYLSEIAPVIETFFRKRGFVDAKVISSERVVGDSTYDVIINIEQGKEFRISCLKISYHDSELVEEIRALTEIREDVVFSEEKISDYKSSIVSFLRKNKKFIFARVIPEVDKRTSEVSVVFKLENLFHVKTGEVVLNGNYHTRSDTIRRILRIVEGEVLTYEKMEKARRNMLHTGIFDYVDLVMLDEHKVAYSKDIVVTMKESERLRLSVGVGLGSDEGGRVFGGFEWRNLADRALTLRLNYRTSRKIDYFMPEPFKTNFINEFSFFEKIDRKINTTLTVPDLFLPFQLSGQLEAFHLYDIRSRGELPYLMNKSGFSFTLFKKHEKRYFLGMGSEFSYRHERDFFNESEGSDNIGENTIKRFVISPEIRAYADLRDNMFFPLKGWMVSGRLQNDATIFGEGAKYTVWENSFSLYYPLIHYRDYAGKMQHRDWVIFHTYAKYGVLFLHSGKMTSDDVLKLGGSSTVRGFNQNALKPSDSTDDLYEGRYYFFIRNEMRWKMVNKVYLTTFFDAGNLWENAENIGKGNFLRTSAGGGLMFVSPIGSMNLNIGFNLFPENEERIWALHFFISTF
ncbi:MAG: BamA/TamA family outer membrane protein, partial [bacterium]